MTGKQTDLIDEVDEDDEGLCVEELLRRQNRLLKDIHHVAISVSRGFAAFLVVARFLSWIIGIMAAIAGAIGLVKLTKGA